MLVDKITIGALSLEEEEEWLQNALMDISFLDNGTQGHAIIAARKMEGYLKDLRLEKYHKDRILESYIPLREWLTKILIELKASKVH